MKKFNGYLFSTTEVVNILTRWAEETFHTLVSVSLPQMADYADESIFVELHANSGLPMNILAELFAKYDNGYDVADEVSENGRTCVLPESISRAIICEAIGKIRNSTMPNYVERVHHNGDLFMMAVTKESEPLECGIAFDIHAGGHDETGRAIEEEA